MFFSGFLGGPGGGTPPLPGPKNRSGGSKMTLLDGILWKSGSKMTPKRGQKRSILGGGPALRMHFLFEKMTPPGSKWPPGGSKMTPRGSKSDLRGGGYPPPFHRGGVPPGTPRTPGGSGDPQNHLRDPSDVKKLKKFFFFNFFYDQGSATKKKFFFSKKIEKTVDFGSLMVFEKFSKKIENFVQKHEKSIRGRKCRKMGQKWHFFGGVKNHEIIDF